MTAHERAAFLTISDERDWWTARMLAAERQAYLSGLAQGWRQGYEAGYEASERNWREMFYPAQREARLAVMRPPRALVERRRWGKDGRRHFGDPRPGDFEGLGR